MIERITTLVKDTAVDITAIKDSLTVITTTGNATYQFTLIVGDTVLTETDVDKVRVTENGAGSLFLTIIDDTDLDLSNGGTLYSDASPVFRQRVFDRDEPNITIPQINIRERQIDNNLQFLNRKIDRDTADAFVDVKSSGNQYVFTQKDGNEKTVGSHPTSLRRYNYIYLANDYDVDADEAMVGLTPVTVEISGFDATSDTPVGNAESVGTIVPSTLIYSGRDDDDHIWSNTIPELPDDPTSTTDPKEKVASNSVTLWIQPVDIIIAGTNITFFRRAAMKTSETDHGITLDELEDGTSEAITAIKAILGEQVSEADADAKAAAASAAAAAGSASSASDSADAAAQDASDAEAAAQIVRDRTPSEQAIAAAANAFAGEDVSPYYLSLIHRDEIGDVGAITALAKGNTAGPSGSELPNEAVIPWVPETKFDKGILVGREFVSNYFGKIAVTVPSLGNDTTNGNNRDLATGIRVTHIFRAPNGVELFRFTHTKMGETKRIKANGSMDEWEMGDFDALSLVKVGTPYTLPDGSAATITQADLDNLNFYYKVDIVILNEGTRSTGNNRTQISTALQVSFYSMAAWFFQLRNLVTLADSKSLGAIRDEVIAAEQTIARLQALASTEADLAKAFAQGTDERLADLSQRGSSAKTYAEEAAADAQEIEDRLENFAASTGVGEQCVEPELELKESETVAEDEETANIDLGDSDSRTTVSLTNGSGSGFADISG